MKLNKLLFYSSVCLILFGCNKETKTKHGIKEDETITILNSEYIIQGQTFNKSIVSVYLFKKTNDSLVPIDTSSVTNNQFVFKGVLESPAYFTIKTNSLSGSYIFLADASKIDMLLHDNLGYSTTYSNSDIQIKYKEYASKIFGFKSKGIDLYYNLKGDFSNANINKLKQQRASLFKEQSDYIVDFISNNPDSYFSVMLLNDNLKYFPTAKLRSLYDLLSSDLKELEFTKSINSSVANMEIEEKERLKVKPITITIPKPSGEYRPNAYAFSGLNPDGNYMSLQSIPQGKVVLLDFWASWCAPCRATNPTLVQLYNKFKDQGLVIMSVSEDKGEGEWINAIYTDNLTWDYHIIDKNKAIAFRYGVESIPHKILIDKYGRIASDKISGSALEHRILELLAE